MTCHVSPGNFRRFLFISDQIFHGPLQHAVTQHVQKRLNCAFATPNCIETRHYSAQLPSLYKTICDTNDRGTGRTDCNFSWSRKIPPPALTTSGKIGLVTREFCFCSESENSRNVIRLPPISAADLHPRLSGFRRRQGKQCEVMLLS